MNEDTRYHLFLLVGWLEMLLFFVAILPPVLPLAMIALLPVALYLALPLLVAKRGQVRAVRWQHSFVRPRRPREAVKEDTSGLYEVPMASFDRQRDPMPPMAYYEERQRH